MYSIPMLKVYCEFLPGVSHIPLLYPNLGRTIRSKHLFLDSAYDELKTPFVEIVEKIDNADYVLVPHNFTFLRNKKKYLDEVFNIAEIHKKKVIIFWHGDSTNHIDRKNMILFRTSQYGYKKRNNEFIMPPYAPDLLHEKFEARSKSGEKPVIGFCGWADYKGFKNRLSTAVKNAGVSIRSITDSKFAVQRKGISIRMDAIKRLNKSDLVSPNFIIRSSFSGHIKTISMDPEVAREEYTENIKNSDLSLVIKGDGNFSLRFYEVLSLGRIPLLVDTDCMLPFEDEIDYSSFILRVPYKNLHRLDILAAKFWEGCSDEKFIQMQQKAREMHEKYLSVPASMRHITEKLL